MVGYDNTSISNISLLLEGVCDNFIDSKSMITASFYKILMDFDSTRGIEKEVFFVLFCLAALNEKNRYTHSHKDCSKIFGESVVHKMNRALYDQARIKARLKRVSEMPEWIIISMEKIGKGEFFDVISTMMIEANKDFKGMIPSFEEMQFMVDRTSLFVGKKFIGFREIEYAIDNYTTK